MGICAKIKIQPLSAPIPEIAAPIAIKYPAYLPPITCPASANGAGEFCKVSVGKIPNKTMVPKI